MVQNRLARRWRQIVIRKKTWYTAECVTRTNTRRHETHLFYRMKEQNVVNGDVIDASVLQSIIAIKICIYIYIYIYIYIQFSLTVIKSKIRKTLCLPHTAERCELSAHELSSVLQVAYHGMQFPATHWNSGHVFSGIIYYYNCKFLVR